MKLFLPILLFLSMYGLSSCSDGEAAKKAEEVLGKEVGKKIEEIGGDKAKEEADKIKEKLKNWDPLKKKKDGQ